MYATYKTGDTLMGKRKQVLDGMILPVELRGMADDATITVEEPASFDVDNEQVQAPFFGGYMEDMLGDMGMTQEQESDMDFIAAELI